MEAVCSLPQVVDFFTPPTMGHSGLKVKIGHFLNNLEKQ
jgi:hypothetical protein